MAFTGPGGLDPFDPNYPQKLAVYNAQQQVALQNDEQLRLFNEACARYLKDPNPSYPAPTPPMQKVVDVSADGLSFSVRFQPWPGLTSPVRPGGSAPPSGPIVSQTPGADRLDQVIAMLGVINAKLDALQKSA